MENLQKSAYQATVDEILIHQGVTLEGLSQEEASKRQKKYGYNVISGKKSKNPFSIFFSQFTNPLVILLLLSALVSLFLQEYIDAGFILFIVATNAVIGFFQEYKAENTIRALKKLLSPRTLVIRDGTETEIESRNLVPGDIVKITAGNAVPADMRLIDVQNLRVDESTLTGESLPIAKNAHAITTDTQMADQHNMVFLGTTVVGGKATGIVIKTGNGTFLGGIAKATVGVQEEKTPLTKKFSHFAKTIGAIVVTSSFLIAVLEIYQGASISSMLKVIVGISVAAIPEGLPIIATIALSISVQRMGRKNAIIRRLPAAETLGSTTLIATDKTGTLTINSMRVVKIFDGSEEYTHVKHDPQNKKLSDLLLCGTLCTETPALHSNKNLVNQVDPTELAVIKASKSAGISDQEINTWRYLDILPFQNEKRIMGSLLERENRKIIYLKGSPEKILSISGEDKNKFLLEKIEEFAKEGLRIIACAEKRIQTGDKLSDNHLHSGFKFLGFFALIDPPRPDAKEAILLCKKAGIKVVMITGDHPTTAVSIARNLGIANAQQSPITGHELSRMSDDNLINILKSTTVFARISPDQKLRIVNAYKDMGEIVAVTGDGVNDAPALKSAHIGVAMGKRGTDVAKEASDMVILDDNFSTIVKAVREARILFENIRKATFFLIPTGFSVILTVFATVMLGYPMPFTAAQLLWVNIVTNGLQDISLAFEPEEKGVLTRPPRKPKEGIMSPLLYRRSVFVAIIITLGVVFMYIRSIDSGVSLDESRTVALSTMIIFQFFQLFNARSETVSVFRKNFFSNKILILSMVFALIAFTLSLTFPPLQWLLKTSTLNPVLLFQITLMAFSVIAVVEADKAISRRHRKLHSS
jgi:calcium-translocating P-type ATPase